MFQIDFLSQASCLNFVLHSHHFDCLDTVLDTSLATQTDQTIVGNKKSCLLEMKLKLCFCGSRHPSAEYKRRLHDRGIMKKLIQRD